MKSIYLSLSLIVLQVHCHHLPGHHNEPESDSDKIISKDQQSSLEEEQGNEAKYYDKIAPNNADFAFKFYRVIASEANGKNIFLSSLSISTSFSLLGLGAKNETQSQIYQGLAFNLAEIEEKEIHKGFQQLINELNQPNNKSYVNIVNALFIRESLKILDTFLDSAKTLYEAEGFSCDFNNPTAAEKQINNYVKNKTHGKIDHAVEDLDQSTVMVIVNSIFFKAYWEKPFDSTWTEEDDFFIDGATTVRVKMMHQQGSFNFFRDNNLSCWVVEVPYKGDASALFILPDVGKMEHVEGALSVETLDRWKKSFTYEEIELFIPKFSFSTSYNVKDLMQRLGVTDAFNDNADLSGITGHQDVKVSKAIHKAVVDIHESGTEAAAVTVIVIMPKSAGPGSHQKIVIKMNKAFLMLVVNKVTHTILFLGKITNPTET